MLDERDGVRHESEVVDICLDVSRSDFMIVLRRSLLLLRVSSFLSLPSRTLFGQLSVRLFGFEETKEIPHV